MKKFIDIKSLPEPMTIIRKEPYFGENEGVLLNERGRLALISLDDISSDDEVRVIFPTKEILAGPAYLVPVTVQIKITNTCNFRCDGCYASAGSTSKKEMTTQQIIKLLDKLAAWGVLTVQWVGGEVFYKKDFEKIVAHAYKLGFQQLLLSNGSIFGERDESFASEAWKYFHTIQISLDFTEERFDRHVHRQGAWSILSKGLKILSETRPEGRELKISTICTQNLEDEVFHIKDYLSTIKISAWKFGKEIAGGRSDVTEESSFGAQMKIWNVIQGFRTDFLTHHYFQKENSPEEIDPEIFDDPGARTFMYILQNGDAYPRPLMSNLPQFCGGNVLRDSMDKIWMSETFQNIRGVRRSDMGCNCGLTCTQRGLDQRLNLLKNGGLLTRPIPHPGCPYYKS